MGPSWGQHGVNMGTHGFLSWVHFGGNMELSWVHWGRNMELSWVHGAILKPTWSYHGFMELFQKPTWSYHGAIARNMEPLRPTWSYRGPTWGQHGAIMGSQHGAISVVSKNSWVHFGCLQKNHGFISGVSKKS